MRITKRIRDVALRVLAPIAMTAALGGATEAATTYNVNYLVQTPYEIDNVVDFFDYGINGVGGFGNTDPPRTLGPFASGFSTNDVVLPGYFFFAGTSYLISEVAARSLAAPQQHLVLSVNDAFADSASGLDFSVLFPAFTAEGYTESNLIDALVCLNSASCVNQSAAGSLLFTFQGAMNSAGADLLLQPLTPGSFTLLAFSDPTQIGTGTTTSTINSITNDVPEPATWLMMIIGFGAIGTALRRRPIRNACSA